MTEGVWGLVALISKVAVALILQLAIVSCVKLGGVVPFADNSLPDIQVLKALEYSKSAHEESNDLPHSALRELVNACQAYSEGIKILPRFQEPVQTRGSSGISVFRNVAPSVVLVLTATFQNDRISDSGLGAGVVIDSSGDILTNWHVVNGYEAAIIFLKPAVGTEPDKNNSYGVRVIASDEAADLAMLKIIKPPSDLPPVRFGELSTIEVAEDIHIIGHPNGNLWSYSTGVISQVRDQFDWTYMDGSKHLAKVLQMQTAINPGNSGGPVLDNSSNMLGLVAMSEEGQNLNYAVAIDVIKAFVDRSHSARTRGTPQNESTKGEIYVGRTSEGMSVKKSVYSDFVSYAVRDAKGTPLETVVETKDGTVLTGTKPVAFGGFADWTYTPSKGRKVYVTSSGAAPDLISSDQVRQ